MHTHNTVEHGHIDVLVEMARHPPLLPLYPPNVWSLLQVNRKRKIE